MKTSDLPGVLYVDPSFAESNGEGCTFAISVHGSGYTLLICTNETRKIMLASSVGSNSPDTHSSLLLNDLPALTKVIPDSSEGVLLFHSERAVLIPGNEILEDEAAASVWSLHFNTISSERVYTSPLTTPESTLVWAGPADLVNAVQAAFPNALPRHAGALLIGTEHLENIANQSFGILLDTRSLLAHVLEGGKTVFFNGFSCPSDGEILYYIAAIAGNTGLTPSDAALTLYGPAPRNESLLQQLRELFPKARYGDTLPALTLLPPEERHRFYLIGRYFHCES